VQNIQTDKGETTSCHIAPALWERFAGARGRDEYCQNWLSLQCALIINATQGVLVIGDPDSDSFEPVAKWPEEGQDPERLAEISERVLEEHCGLLAPLEPPAGGTPSKPPVYGAAYPILVDNRMHGVVAVEVMSDSQEHLKSVMEDLQWGVSWMELLFRRRQVQEDGATLARLKSAVDLLAGVLSEESFKAACMGFVTELAIGIQCDRVSLAFMHKNHARIQAVSHSAQFGKRMNLIRAIGKAMDEAVVQRKEIIYPSPPEAQVLIVRDHSQLAEQHGAGSILTMPFFGKDRYLGVMTLERPSGHPFSEEEASFCRSVGALLFPALEAKRLNDRLLINKLMDSVKVQLFRLLGPRYLGRKLLALFIVAVVAFFTFQTGEYRISSNTVLEGAVMRVVVSPFEGYVKEAPVRPGEVVESGTVMCTLDDRDFRLERLNWLSKRTQYQRQYQEAIAQHKRAEAKIINAQLEQTTAQLNLVESRLKRTRILAPFKGLVLSGDLSQRLGGSVEKGEVLFEVAPLDTYRVIVEVDERRVADVEAGQRGSMILSSLPNEHFDFVVQKITPISTTREGLNYFRVEAGLENISDRLRPGMEGVGKISVDRRKLISIWTRSLREWVRLWVWSWWP
jgi:multidrug resistance efflux pump